MEPTGLSQFWPYVFGAAGAEDPEVAATYSDLMAQRQMMIAQATKREVSLSGVTHLLDEGGGTGAFLGEAGAANRAMQMSLFDLPAVVGPARERFARLGMADRVEIIPGSFRDDPLPHGADAISLVRVLYDHADATVEALLAQVYDALPPGGLVIVCVPMCGGARPERAGVVDGAVYSLAMMSGRARSAEEIAAFCAAAGFDSVHTTRAPRPYVTRVVTARKPLS